MRAVRLVTRGYAAQALENASSSERMAGPAKLEEHKWQEFFKDPSKWWDNRMTKRNSQHADFVHASTRERLWIHSSFSPVWLPRKLKTLQLSTFDFEQPMVRASYIPTTHSESPQHPGKNFDDFPQSKSREFSQRREDLILCTSLEQLKKAHARLLKSQNDSQMAKTLVAMYCKFGSMVEAREIFDKMEEPGLGSWNAMVRGYAETGDGKAALEFFERMQEAGLSPDSRLFVLALKTCGGLAAKGREASLVKAKALHSQVRKCGHESNIFVANTLLDMYAKCGSMTNAQKLFERMSYQDTVSWNAVITGYVQNGESAVALELFSKMQAEEFKPNARTFLAAVNACSSLAAIADQKGKSSYLEKGRRIHEQLRKMNLQDDIFLANGLVDMYAKCGNMVDARKVFDSMKERTLVSWNAVIMGYAQNAEAEMALNFYRNMGTQGFKANARTYVAALHACSSLAAKEEGKKDKDGKIVKADSLEKGREIHSLVKKKGLGSNLFVANSLVDMYAKCGSLEEAREVFRPVLRKDLALWNVMLMGYAQGGQGDKALKLFRRMQAAEDLKPNPRTYVAVLTACSDVAVKEEGKEIEGKVVKKESLARAIEVHSQVSEAGYESNVFVTSSLVDVYVKCGSMKEARGVFDKMEKRDLIVWNGMIQGYIESGEKDLAMELYRRMKEEGMVTADGATYVAALKACGDLGSGKAVHGEIKKAGLDKEVDVAEALAGFYKRCQP